MERIIKQKKFHRPKRHYATRYARKGVLVFPVHTPTKDGGCSCSNPDCKNVGKHPLTRKGVKDATTNIQQIREWWEKWPDANIGLATGKKSGIFVLDVDDGGEEELENFPTLPNTVESVTGGGGRHLFFEYPKNTEITNSTPFKKIHIRGNGGFVIVPPSHHKSKNRYKWKYEESLTQYHPADCPRWLLEAIENNKNRMDTTKRPNSTTTPINKDRIEQQVKYIVKQIKEGKVIIGDD